MLLDSDQVEYIILTVVIHIKEKPLAVIKQIFTHKHHIAGVCFAVRIYVENSVGLADPAVYTFTVSKIVSVNRAIDIMYFSVC